MKINVLHLIDHYRIGGPGKTIINTCKFIDKKKYEIHIGSFLENDTIDTEFSRKIKDLDIPYMSLFDRRGISLQNIRKISNYTKAHDIHILHCHDYKTDLHGILYKILFPKIKVVTTHHGWINNNLSQRIFSLLALKGSFILDGVIAVSDKLYELFPIMSKLRKNRVTIHNGIVLSDYQSHGQRDEIRKKFGVQPDDILLGVVGRLSPEKGCVEMLEAFNDATQKMKYIRLMYVGEGDLDSRLSQRIKDLKLENKVILAGYHNPVQPYIEALDILVCPSHTEGLSNVILEALAFDKAVIATHVGGNPEIITDMKNGLLVAPANPAKLTKAILRLTTSGEMRKAFAAEGKITLSEKFDFLVRTRRLIKFYRSVLT